MSSSTSENGESSRTVDNPEHEDENDSTFSPPHNIEVPVTSRVLRGQSEPLASSSPKDSSVDDSLYTDTHSQNANSIIIIEDSKDFSQSNQEHYVDFNNPFCLFPQICENHKHYVDTHNPFCYFPQICAIDHAEKPRKMPAPTISLSYINNITKLGDVKDGKANDNWMLWSQRMRSFLTIQDLWVDVN